MGSEAAASHTLITGGNGRLLSPAAGLINASLPLTVAGDSVTVAVALPPYTAGDVIMIRLPMPLSLGLLPPLQWPLPSQTLNMYGRMVKLAVL